MSEDPTPPPQQQESQPGREHEMTPRPEAEPRHPGAGKLESRAAIITGGDSGIGRAVAVLFAREGADVLVSYLDEHEDAQETKRLVEEEGRRCVIVAGDIGDEAHAADLVRRAIEEFGHLDMLVNNAAEQHPQKSLEDITSEQLEAHLPHQHLRHVLPDQGGAAAPEGGRERSSTRLGHGLQGQRRLARLLVDQGRDRGLHALAGAAAWPRGASASTPSRRGPSGRRSSRPRSARSKSTEFGSDVPLGRPGQPDEVAPCYVVPGLGRRART